MARPAWLDSSPGEFPREPARQVCRLPCQVILDDSALEVLLDDYTNRGFRIRTRHRLAIGGALELKLPNCMPVEATVRWSLENKAGCAFKRAVKPDLIQLAIETAMADLGSRTS